MGIGRNDDVENEEEQENNRQYIQTDSIQAPYEQS